MGRGDCPNCRPGVSRTVIVGLEGVGCVNPGRARECVGLEFFCIHARIADSIDHKKLLGIFFNIYI